MGAVLSGNARTVLRKKVLTMERRGTKQNVVFKSAKNPVTDPHLPSFSKRPCVVSH